MPLLYHFADSDLNRTLELFVRMVRDELGDVLVSMMLYGSVTFDDLAPGYGDLDFLAVVRSDVSERQRERLITLRQVLRSGRYGVYANMLEGAFLPREMLDPLRSGQALWWGTTKERPWGHNELGWLVLEVIRKRGIVVWGEDVRPDIPEPTPAMLFQDVGCACENMRRDGKGGSLHSVDWLLTAARLLLWLREGRLSSKSEAALWGEANARGDWAKLLARASYLRLEPSAASQPEQAAWLDGLTGPIQEACSELEKELAAHWQTPVAGTIEKNPSPTTPTDKSPGLP